VIYPTFLVPIYTYTALLVPFYQYLRLTRQGTDPIAWVAAGNKPTGRGHSIVFDLVFSFLCFVIVLPWKLSILLNAFHLFFIFILC